ncbi:AGAP011225-PA-like protein [Anopheles sinensis]|uniref:AGAP011225-PA-like protein n=1 Tax=Anopheles sinensis TaxID=74873 RepID=A0A084VKE3_ANOSI|nr:AGAP011225-PA-like protein [Anopheles sinensis]
MENIEQQQETSQTELSKIEDNKKNLDMLMDSVQNMTTLSDKSYKILEAHFIYPARSCRHVRKLSGRYIIQVGENLQPLEVVCEQNKFDGGWTVVQYRFNGSVDFYRNWTEYRNGFGDLDGEFWLGLENLHQMTKNRPHELMIELKDFKGNYGYAKYGNFELGSESEMFKLKRLGSYSGTAGNGMQRNWEHKFTTFDRDNDILDIGNCAEERHGAWWYWHCTESNLNGRYQDTARNDSALTWYNFEGDWRGLSYSRMMIRDIIDNVSENDNLNEGGF